MGQQLVAQAVEQARLVDRRPGLSGCPEMEAPRYDGPWMLRLPLDEALGDVVEAGAVDHQLGQ